METDRLASQGAYTVDFRRPSSVTPGQVPGGRSYTMYTWDDSSGNVVQAYWKVDGMDHAWSGGRAGKPFSDPQGPNASLAMYQFFLAHPLRELEVSARSIHLADESLRQYVALSGS